MMNGERRGRVSPPESVAGDRPKPRWKVVFLASYDSPPKDGGRGTRRSPFYAANPNLSSAENAALLESILVDESKCSDGCTFTLLPGRYSLGLAERVPANTR